MSNNNTDDDKYWRQIALLQDSFLKLWQMYVAWFTWFYGINIIALSWVITSKDVNVRLAKPLAALMTLGMIVSLISVYKMYSYILLVRRSGAELEQCMTPSLKPTKIIDTIFGEVIAEYALIAIFLGGLLLFLSWIFVIVYIY